MKKILSIKNIISLLLQNCNYIHILLVVIITSCDSENANDCLQTDGDTITYTVDLPSFSKIQLEDDIRVILKEGPEQVVTIETGENLVSDLSINVAEETLILQNNNGCNFVREYGKTLVMITAPTITFIRQASSFPIKSDGVLSYPALSVWSNTNPNNLDIQDPNKSGLVELEIDAEIFAISANGSSNFIISGNTDSASITLSDEFPQMDGRNLIINDLTLRHTSAAQMIVNPQNSIKGTIRATGDVISVNRPAVVEVEELFTGRLIFE